MAASADGGTVFADIRRSKWRGLVQIQGGRQTTIMRLEDPQEHQIFGKGGFDGRWLVFGVGYNRADPSEWSVHAWDSVTGGPPKLLADNPAGIPSPPLNPLVHKGKATWIQGRPGLQSDVHLYDLATGTDRIVYSKPASKVFFLDSLLVWRAGYSDPDPRPFMAVDINTAAPVDLPSPLREAKSSGDVNGSGQTVAWNRNKDDAVPGPGPAGDVEHTIWVWRTGWNGGPRPVITADQEGNYVSVHEVIGDLVLFWMMPSEDGYYAADLRSGSYTFVGKFLRPVADDLLAASTMSGTKASPAYSTSLVRVSQLPPLPTC